MNFSCDKCQAQYTVADAKVGARGFRVACKKCQHVMVVGAAGQGADGEAPASWYVAIADAQVGPIDLSEVKRRLGDGSLTAQSLAWRTGMTDWQPLGSIAELRHLLPTRDDAAAVTGETELSSTATTTEVPLGTPDGAVDGAASASGWQPSAAIALSELVEQEMQAAEAPPADAPLPPPVSVGAGPPPDDEPPAPWTVSQRSDASGRLRRLLGLCAVGILLVGGGLFWALQQRAEPTPQPSAPQATPTQTAPPAAEHASPPAPKIPPAASPAPAAQDSAPAAPRKPLPLTAEQRRALERRHLERPKPRIVTVPPPARGEDGALKETLTSADIWSVVRSQAKSVAPCLTKARSRGELAAGNYTFKLDWVVSASGRVSDAQLKGPDAALGTSLPGCFASVMATWRFPAAQTGTPVHNFPFGPIRVP